MIQSHKPLHGIRVLELGGYISGPYASSLLCALGADVVKVERPGNGDDFRRQQNEHSPYFVQYNAGKRSLAANLKNPEGVDLVRALIPRFDVVLENMRPGKLDALGLGPRICAELKSDLIYTSVTGFGNGGPLQDRAAYDTIGQSFGGIYSLLSEPGAAQLSGTILADLITGLSTATGVLAALIGRLRSGFGQRLETSLMESVSTITIDAITQYFQRAEDPSRQSRHPQAQNFCLMTASGGSITLHLSSSQKFWINLCSAMDREDLVADPRYATFTQREDRYAELHEIVAGIFKTRTAQEWEQRLNERDVPFAPVLTMSGYADHPQTKWLDIITPAEYGTSLVRPPWRFDGARPERTEPAPRVGQHTIEIASEVYNSRDIDELLLKGVLFVDPAHKEPPIRKENATGLPAT